MARTSLSLQILLVGAFSALCVTAACSVQTTTTGAGGGGGDGGSEPTPAEDGGQGGSSGSVKNDGGTSPGSDASTSPGTDSGSTNDDGGTSSDTGAPDDRLMPLEVGRSWTYDVAAVGNGYCPTGSHDSKVLGTSQQDGRTAFQVTSFCGTIGSSYETVNGDQVDVDYQGSWNHYLDVPVQEGHSWPYFNTSYTWESVASITVPAGTYTNCWKAHQNVTYTAYAVFCRGVGMVESVSQDLAGNGWDAKLTAKNF